MKRVNKCALVKMRGDMKGLSDRIYFGNILELRGRPHPLYMLMGSAVSFRTKTTRFHTEVLVFCSLLIRSFDTEAHTKGKHDTETLIRHLQGENASTYAALNVTTQFAGECAHCQQLE